MRVIAGRARGRRLKAPPGMDTRPITDMIKEALFNVLGDTVEGTCFLDLFAGSGSVGIEALSRGAAKAVFIDKSLASVEIIKENLANCGFSQGFEVYRNDIFKALDLLERRQMIFDLIYIDPPFTQEDLFDKVMYKLDKTNVLSECGIMIIRTRRKKQLPSNLNSLDEYRVNDYGESTLHYYRIFKEVRN